MSDTQQKVSLDQPIAPPPPMQNQPSPGESGYVPPVDSVPLPSKGVVYPVDSPLANMDTIDIRSMTAREEDILASRALLKQGKALGALIKACVLNKSIDVEQLLSGDRNAILIAIRITGYGKEYDVTVQCPACDEEFKHTFDLAKLEIKPLGQQPLESNKNAFEYVLPISNKRVVFKLLTGADERDITVMQERMKKATGVHGPENPVTTRLFFQVLQIGSETDRNKLSQIIKNLPAMDSRKLRKYIDDMSPGVQMEQGVTCPACGELREVTVPFGTEFFWPQS